MFSKPTRGVLVGVVALVASLLCAPAAHAQATGATDIDITVQGVVILHYFSNIDLTLQTSDLETFLGYGGKTSDEGTITGTGFSPNVDMASSITAPSGDPSAATLTLQNAWAVRAIAASGSSVTVAVTLTDNQLVHATDITKNIDLSSALVSEDGSTYAASRSFAAPGLISPEYGNVRMTLDMTDATLSGQYVDGVYTLTVTIL